jgi:hypothetical protein
VLRINEAEWREHLGPPDVPAPPSVPQPDEHPEAGAALAGAGGLRADATVQKGHLVDATEDQIRAAISVVYDEKGDERPSYRNIVSPVRAWLKDKGSMPSGTQSSKLLGDQSLRPAATSRVLRVRVGKRIIVQNFSGWKNS